MAGRRPNIADKDKKLHVALGADHSGFVLKNELLSRLRGQ